MIALEVFYIGLSTIAVMVILQIVVYVINKLMEPPKVIYREVHVSPSSMTTVPPPPPVITKEPVFSEQAEEQVRLPEYEPRQQTSTALRMDPQLPPGLQETNPIRS